MSRMTTCFRCGSVHDSDDVNLTELHRRMKAHDMGIVRKERARIRKALQEASKFVKGLTPGDGTSEDPWVGAVSCMYNRAIDAVRR